MGLDGFPTDALLSESQAVQANSSVARLALVAPPESPSDNSTLIASAQSGSAPQGALLPTSDGIPQTASPLDQTFATATTFPTAASLFANPAANPAAPPTVPATGPSSPTGAASSGNNTGSAGTLPLTNGQAISTTPPAAANGAAPGDDLWHGASTQNNPSGTPPGASPFDGPTGPTGGPGQPGNPGQPGGPGSLSWNGPSFSWGITPPPAPVVTNPGTQANAEGSSVALQIVATDPSGASLGYDAVGLPKGLTINHASGLIFGSVDYQAGESFGGSYTTAVVVVDSKGASSAQQFTWNVANTLRPPVVTNPGAKTNVLGDAVSLQISASQPDNDQLSYDANGLPPGLSIDSSSGVIGGTIDTSLSTLAASPYSATVLVTDQGLTVSQSFTWTVAADNHPPVWTAPGSQVNAASDTVSLPLTATDPDSNPLTYTVASLPAGLTIDPATGAVAGTIADSAANASPYSVTVTASNGLTSASQTIPWTVNVVGVTNPGDQNSVNGNAVTLALTAHDASGLPLTYTATGLPPGLAVNATTGAITGTLSSSADAGGPYVVTVTAADGTNSATRAFTWNVAHVGLTNPGDQTTATGAAVSVPLSATDVTGTPTFSATGLPAGVSINATTGLISGTVASGAFHGGPFAVSVTATDGGYTASQTFTWNVTHAADAAPAFNNPGAQTNADGDVLNLTLAASESDGDQLQFSATGLRDGLIVDTYSGVISGTVTPAAVQAAPYAVTITADDGYGGAASQSFNWTVHDAALTVQGGSIQIQEGQLLDGTTVATLTDADAARVASDFAATLTWEDGTTSAGQVEGSAGSFTITGRHLYNHPGTFAVGVSVTDVAGSTATGAGSTAVAVAPLTMTAGTFGDAVAGVPSTQTVAIFTDANTNDTADHFAATIAWGDGLSSAGYVTGSQGQFEIAGTHTYATHGMFQATITVSDEDGTTATTFSPQPVGDIYKGIEADLTVAGFASTNTTAQASDFSALITWGDGSTSGGIISGSGGAFTVAANHTYVNDFPGNVQVTVADNGGHTISVSGFAILVRPPVMAAANRVVAPPSNGMASLLLGVYADANPNDTAAQFTATVNWGDGTNTSGTVVQKAPGLFEVLGTPMSYTSPGLYRVVTRLAWGGGTTSAITTSNVAAEAVAPQIEWIGPHVVPGMSIYTFDVSIPETLAKEIDPEAKFVAKNAAVISGTHWYNSKTGDDVTGNYTGFRVVVRFDNDPAEATITLKNWLKGDATPVEDFKVTVVQVKVETPKAAFSIGKLTEKPLEGLTKKNDNTIIEGIKQTAYDKIVFSTDPDNRKIPGIIWTAKVTLLGPGRDGTLGVNRIIAGFHQEVKVVTQKALFGKQYLEGSLQGSTYPDCENPQAKPWVREKDETGGTLVSGLVIPANFIQGKAGPILIGDNDSPNGGWPVIISKQQGGFSYADHGELLEEFQVSVAVETLDEAGTDVSRHLFSEAGAMWSLNTSGGINFTFNEKKIVTKATWLAGKEAGIFAPRGESWAIVAQPTLLRTTGETANEAAADISWTVKNQ